MEITEVRVFPVDEGKLKAFVSIVLDECFIVTDIKIIHGKNGMFISMPSKKKRNGGFRDIAHPLNRETRKMIEDTVFPAYYDRTGQPPADQIGAGPADDAAVTPEEWNEQEQEEEKSPFMGSEGDTPPTATEF